MNPIVVIAATHHEVSRLAGRITTARPPFSLYETIVGNDRILTLVTGIGKVNAAAGITWLLQHTTPRLLVVTGCAGAFPGCGLKIGDLAVASSEIYADEGVITPQGWHGLSAIGIPTVEKGGVLYFNEFPLNSSLIMKAVNRATALGLPLLSGPFLTVSTCSGTATRGAELQSRYNAIAENMEGAASAHVALINDLECLEIRGISNMVEDRDRSRWDISAAIGQAQNFLLELLPHL